MTVVRRIGIVGAGFAGLSTAKVLKALGYEVRVFEKEPDVGGVWAASRRYPGLTTQNVRSTYALSDHPMPASWPEWPSGEQVQRYLQSYVDRFGLAPHLRMSTTVESAVLDEAAGLWTVVARSGDVREAHRFDHLVVCNGIFSEPEVPTFAGRDDFVAAGGRVCHTSEFGDVEAARGRHLLVVGYGKSSGDVANAAAEIAASTTVLARQLIWKIPKKFMNVLNYKFLLLTRMGEALFKYIEPKGFEKFLHGPGKPVRDSMLGSVESVVTRQLRLRQLDLHPGTPLETIARSTVSLVRDGFYEKVASGRLTVKKGATIARLRPGQALLSTGETVPADLAWMEARTEGKHAKGTNIIPFSVHNIDELLGDLGLQLGVLTRFKQWLMPIDPGDYRVVTSRLLERHRAAPAKGPTTVRA